MGAKCQIINNGWLLDPVILERGLRQVGPLGPLLFAILVNPLLKDWQGRVKFVDDTTVLEIIPRCSPSLMHVVVG